MLALRVGVAVTWCNAWLAGDASLDEAALHVAESTGRPWVTGVPGEDGAASWPVVLGRLRGAGAVGFVLSLPVPGDPLGLAGPVSFNADAVAAGAAMVVDADPTPYGLVPAAGSQAWSARAVLSPATPDTVRAAARELADAVTASTRELEHLDVAHGHPRARSSLDAATRVLADHPPAPGLPQRALSLLVSAARLLALMEVAATTEGATVTAGEARLRRGSLQPVDAAARRALVAACSQSPRAY